MAVVEVGTGGRFDATNLLEPLVSAISPISYDHTPTLGDTLTQIAWHKAGILRPGRPGISAPQVEEARRTIEHEARKLGTHLEEVGREWRWARTDADIRITSTHADFAPLEITVSLLGDHQRDNATATVAALEALGRAHPALMCSRAAIASGLRAVEWPGRLQVLAEQPLVVLDGAHNAASANVLHTAIEANFHFERLHLVLGLSAGKDARGVLEALAPRADALYLTRSAHERAATTHDLATLAPGTHAHEFEHAADALDAALSQAAPQDLVLVTGSLFLVGETLVWWRRSHP